MVEKSKEELERDGQYRSGRHRDRQDQESPAIPVIGSPELMASSMDDLARVAFDGLVDCLPEGTVGTADSMSLTILATTWSRWVMLTMNMDEWSAHPYSDNYYRLFRMVTECEKQIKQLSSEFGMTPRSRTQIKLQLQQSTELKSLKDQLEEMRDVLLSQ